MTKNTSWLHSKTSFMRGQQCVKSMYLHRFSRNKSDQLTPIQNKLADKGQNFEKQFRKAHFPYGKNLKTAYGQDLEQYLLKTKEILKEQSDCSIFEAAIVAHKVFVMLDVLRKNKDGSIDVFEVKNSSKMKAKFLWDAALQYFVCNEIFDTKLNSFNLILKGRNNTFKTMNISKQANKKLPEIIDKLNYFSTILQGSEAPEIKMGKHCNIPYVCDFKGYCKSES